MEKIIKVIDFGEESPLKINLGGMFVNFTDELIITEDENHQNQTIEVIDRKNILISSEEAENIAQ